MAATIRLKRQETAEDIARLGAAMRAWFAGDPELQHILALWIREYLLRDLKPELDVPESYDLRAVTMQFAERIKEQIRQREQSALQQGLQEGVLQGEALLLQRMLTRRFGPLPEWARQRLEDATSNELETWADRVLDAARLEDVFAR
ncbi:DUF4351 domain-containing protein [Tepidiphilus olei]|uniref:DUF4351 domain-containing protein n=1 Tax=Tepidiphilus olei TaxID=2502184 RepID=UPI00115F0588|nr:DUF4351 domain-containing protein [Tepidiphilus olei]